MPSHMFCKYCGKQLPENSNYCPSCGRKQKEVSNLPLIFVMKLMKVYHEHRSIVLIYSIWILIHFSLLLFSFGSSKASDAFYPFNYSISELLDRNFVYKKPLRFSLISNSNVYDYSEFFFYVFFLPIMTCLGIRISPYIKPYYLKIGNYLKAIYIRCKLYACYFRKKGNKQKKPSSKLIDFTIDDNTNKTSRNNDNKRDSENGIHPMSLLKRLFGSITDKMIILILFGALLFITAFLPHHLSRQFSGALGCYIGMTMACPSEYDIITNGVYTSTGWTATELYIYVTSFFAIVNLIYYLFTESCYKASIGKLLFNGKLVDVYGDAVTFNDCITRSFVCGVYFVLIIIFHFLFDLNNVQTFILFFSLMDFPVLFIRKSLLDFFTNSIYVKRKNLN